MPEKTEKPDPVMGESPRERDYLHKIRLGLIPVVSAQIRTPVDIPSVRKKSGGCVQFVFRRLYEKMIKKNLTLFEVVNLNRMTRGLCHHCWASNVPITLDPKGNPECGNCKRRRNQHV